MRKRGFTLIELIVVIAIIGILAAVIAPRAFQAIEKAKVAKAYTDYKALRSGSLELYADTGHYPHGYNSQIRAIDSDLMVDVSHWNNWNGPYMDNFAGATPWSGTYYFNTNANMGRGPWYELSVEFENCCFGYPQPNTGCPVPLTSVDKIDANLDDGNRSTGEVQLVSWGDMHWVLLWDFCPTADCW